MISYLLVVEQHRTQIVIHALLKCQQENLYHEQNVRSEERFSRNAETDLVCRLLLEKKKKRQLREGVQGRRDKSRKKPAVGACVHRSTPLAMNQRGRKPTTEH